MIVGWSFTANCLLNPCRGYWSDTDPGHVFSEEPPPVSATVLQFGYRYSRIRKQIYSQNHSQLNRGEDFNRQKQDTVGMKTCPAICKEYFKEVDPHGTRKIFNRFYGDTWWRRQWRILWVKDDSWIIKTNKEMNCGFYLRVLVGKNSIQVGKYSTATV